MHALPVIHYADLSVQPWKNGKGVSRTVLSDSDALGAWSWKVSVAEISHPSPTANILESSGFRWP